MKKYLIIFVNLMFLASSYGQFGFGAHPKGLDWQYVKSPAVNVIYPKGMKAQAMRVANMINYEKENCHGSIGEKAIKLNLVIQNQTVISNGYVGLAPFRSEFFSTPMQNMHYLGSLDWLDMLSIHEYRHALQYSNSKYGITKLLSFFFGEYGWAAGLNIAVPNWYFEGDAVITETALSQGGRGRMPSFTVQQRALAKDNINFDYQINRNGSYRYNIPNHYPLGYMMLTYLRNEEGNAVMPPILKRSTSYFSILYSFSRSLKKFTGYTTTNLYNASWLNAKAQWKEKVENTDLNETIPVTKENTKTVTNYHFPQYTQKGDIIALKSSYKENPHFVKITGEGEEKITELGFSMESHFDYANQKLVWTEFTQHPRRTNLTYSDICLYDIEKKTKQKITHKGKYFAPSLNSTATKIISVYITPNQVSSLREINVDTKVENTILTFNDGEFVSSPSYTQDDKSIVYLIKKNSKLALFKLDKKTKKKTQLCPWTSHIIGPPSVSDGFVYFSTSYTGIDNICRVSLDGNQSQEQISSVPIGAYEPSTLKGQNSVLFVEHTKNGKVISKMDISPELNKSKVLKNIAEPVDMSWQDEVAAKEEGGNILNKIPKTEYETAPYTGLLRDLTLHSWVIIPDHQNPQINVYFNNYLNDISASIGAGYNTVEGGTNYNAQVSIAKWYPIISLIAFQGNRKTDFLDNSDILREVSFNETKFGLNVGLPLKWLNGSYAYGIGTNLGIYQQHTSNLINLQDNTSLPNKNPAYNSISAKVDFYWIKRSAYQNLATKMGIKSSFQFQTNINSSDNQRIFASTKLYLPGLAKNHSFRLSGGYQKELLSNSFQYMDIFQYTRGFELSPNDEYLRLSVEYSFVLSYPDMGFVGITYFKRVSANFFYDYGQSSFIKNNLNTNYQSAGMEIIFENTVLNLIPMGFGLRLTQPLTGRQNNLVPELFIFEGF